MKIHILSGDSLVEPFSKTELEGEVIVCRECLVDGPVSAEGLEDFWELRERYLTKSFPEVEQDYREKVVDQFVHAWNSADGNEVNLWFEYEAFCQVNLWFTIWMLRNTDARFAIVYPQPKEPSDIWKGFSQHDSDGLFDCYLNKVRLTHDDVFLAVRLWEAYQKGDGDELVSLGKKEAKAFPTLEDVTMAVSERDSAPREAVQQIIASGKSTFGEVFQEFSETQGIWGLGDLQVKRIYDELAG